MLKKTIISVTAVAALALATGAIADIASAVYSDSDNSAAAAYPGGFYLRGQAGYGFADSESVKVAGANSLLSGDLTVDNKNSDGLAGRIAAGYNFNQYFGLEAGFAMYSDLKTNFSDQAIDINSGRIINTHDTVKTSMYSIDLLGKAAYPFANNFYAFVEGGAAYLHLDTKDVSSDTKYLNDGYIRPKAGVGLGYNINQHMAVDVSYDRIFGKEKITNEEFVPSINTVMAGFTYKF